MARPRQKAYKGKSVCKSNCSGHRAGARYARSGGRTSSPHSSSFNNGMMIELGTFVKRPKSP